MTQSSWLLMLHCKVAMLLVIDAMSPAAAGAVLLTPWKISILTQFHNFITISIQKDYLTLGATLAIFDLSTVNWMAWAAGFVLK